MPSRESVTVQFGADVTQFQQGVQRMNQITDQFSQGLEHRLLGSRHVIGALFAGLGLGGGLEGLANKIAEAITGGTKKGFEEAAAAQDKFAEAFEKSIEQHLGGGALLRHLQGQLQQAQAEASRPRATSGITTGILGPGAVGAMADRFGLFGAESSPEAQKRQADAARKALEIKERIAEEEKRQAGVGTQIAEDNNRLARIGVSEEEKLLGLKADRAETEKRIAAEQAAVRHGTGEQKEVDRLILEWSKQGIAIAEQENRIKVEGLKEQKKLQDEIAKNDTEEQTKENAIRAEREKITEELTKQNALLKERQSDLATARADRGLPGLSELAHGRGVGSAVARQAEHFENLAIERSGSAPGESARFNQKALDLRKSLGGLVKSGDADPFKNMEKGINEIAKQAALTAQRLLPVGARR